MGLVYTIPVSTPEDTRQNTQYVRHNEARKTKTNFRNSCVAEISRERDFFRLIARHEFIQFAHTHTHTYIHRKEGENIDIYLVFFSVRIVNLFSFTWE